jgi:hypothetical protein
METFYRTTSFIQIWAVTFAIKIRGFLVEAGALQPVQKTLHQLGDWFELAP